MAGAGSVALGSGDIPVAAQGCRRRPAANVVIHEPADALAGRVVGQVAEAGIRRVRRRDVERIIADLREERFLQSVDAQSGLRSFCCARVGMGNAVASAGTIVERVRLQPEASPYLLVKRYRQNHVPGASGWLCV